MSFGPVPGQTLNGPGCHLGVAAARVTHRPSHLTSSVACGVLLCHCDPYLPHSPVKDPAPSTAADAMLQMLSLWNASPTYSTYQLAMLVPLEEYAEYCPSYAGWGLFPLMPVSQVRPVARNCPEEPGADASPCPPWCSPSASRRPRRSRPRAAPTRTTRTRAMCGTCVSSRSERADGTRVATGGRAGRISRASAHSSA